MALTKITSTNIGANAVTSALIANVSSSTITTGLGYTPANKAGDTFTNNINIGYDGYPAIKFRNAAGTDKAEMYVGTSAGDLNIVVNSQAAIAIDSSGRVKKPYQPAFKVVRNNGGGNVSADEIIPFNYAVLNHGSHFNTSTYTFTAPVTGYYLLSYGGMNSQSNTGATLFRLYVNGVQKSYHHILGTHPSSTSYTYVQYMSSGDTSYIRGSNYHYGDGPNGYDYPYFNGYLLG